MVPSIVGYNTGIDRMDDLPTSYEEESLDSRSTLAILRDEFQAAARQGPKLFHAMYQFRGITEFRPNNVPSHCGGPCIYGLENGFEVAYYYRQPGAEFCRTQLTEFCRLAEAAARCIESESLPPYPSDENRYLRHLLDCPDSRELWLSAVYRIAWNHAGPLLRAEPSIRGKWVGSELLYASHLLDECVGGTRWAVCVPLSPDVFLASALAIDHMLGRTADKDMHFMELAIEEARKSIGEDERAHPKVGAVVVKNGVVLATAFRGELGEGEHAEYTALEKKLPDATLAGATVYATLEPCTSRNHPKTPCAQRLIDRKVKRVVIGMLDPNPRICGKGERLLRDHGIEVERFPHELVMKLEEMNREFVKAQGQAALYAPTLQRPAIDSNASLRDLQRRFVEAQDRFPREVSFAIVMIPHDERPAWKQANEWFGDMIAGPPRKDGWRCLMWAGGGDTPETITIPASEREDGGNFPILYSLDQWRCWLMRRSKMAEYPETALNMFLSLASDACRQLDVKDCGLIVDGQHVGGERGGYEHLLRWSVEQLPNEECKKLTWLDAPYEQTRTTLRPGRTPRRWVVELPCVFAAVAQALDQHIAGKGSLWPAPSTRNEDGDQKSLSDA